jgi:hypothetical protein
LNDDHQRKLPNRSGNLNELLSMENRLIIYLFMLIGLSCKKEEEPLGICVNRCNSTSPWKVETLDLGLPCFATQDACRTWAASHGYGDKTCVLCD